VQSILPETHTVLFFSRSQLICCSLCASRMAARRATGACSGHVMPRTVVVGKLTEGLTSVSAVARTCRGQCRGRSL